MTLTPGTRLGPYEILSPLGAGGMGEVWRARDARLGRDVAIKALPAAFAQDPGRLARFEREAKVLASLNHPNVAGIHGLEEVDGHRYLILEFVEGETLADRLSRGPLPVDDAVEVCREIAAGVEAAHENGVVHRDLKPGNVMITPAGAVKVLDFGLAKGAEAAGSSSGPPLSASPTITFAATAAGVILGTAAYMSPEQARGKPVDRRTDIWSFGCVLYECLTGRQVFEGETVSDVIARILERDPEWNALPGATPGPVRELLSRCLTKDPKLRLRDIGEARVVLGEAFARTSGARRGGESAGMAVGSGAAAASTAPRTTAGRRAVLFPWIVAGVAVLAAVAIGTRPRLEPVRDPVTLSILLPRGDRLDGGLEYNLLALAPDGKAVAYCARHEGIVRLYYRRLDRREAVELPGSQDARDPFFSPDGEWIGFFSGTRLRKVSVRGGTPVDLAEVTADRGGVWLGDGSIIYSPAFSSPLYRIPAEGGTPVAVTTLDSTKAERTHRWPSVLPGGDWVLFTVGVQESPGGYDDAAIEAVSLRTGERRVLAKGSCARFAPGNRLVVARAGSLYMLPLDPRNPNGGGTPSPVLDGVLGEPTSGAVFFDIAMDGTLVHVAGKGGLEETQLGWAAADGSITPLPGAPRQFIKFRVSPDGTQALTEIGPGGGKSAIWLLDLERGTQSLLTFGRPGYRGSDGFPIWMPDGRDFVYIRDGDGGDQIVTRRVDGTDSVRVLFQASSLLTLSGVDPSGRRVLFSEYGTSEGEIWTLDVDGRTPPRRLIGGPESQGSGVVSPDGKWLAYSSDESGEREVVVSSIERPESRIQVSMSGGAQPLWAPDGRTIYFQSNGALYGARVEVRGDALSVDPPRRLFELFGVSGDTSVLDFDVHPAGEKFLVRVPLDDALERREITVSLGWAGATLGS